MKLYMINTCGGGQVYVVAPDPTRAWERAKEQWKEQGYWTHCPDYELRSITLIAEDVKNPDCGMGLCLPGSYFGKPADHKKEETP